MALLFSLLLPPLLLLPLGGAYRYSRPIVHHLVDKHDADCDKRYGGSGAAAAAADAAAAAAAAVESPLSVDGSLKLTTAPAGADALRDLKVCSGATQLVPFGELIRDPRGIQFWYLRLRVTRLARGQTLVVINVDKETLDSLVVNSDQRFDITDGWSGFPADLRLRYRYVRLYWMSTVPSTATNAVNITVSRYALFSGNLNSTERRDLCDRYTNLWCEAPAGGVCVSPGTCSLQPDCFDQFNEPNKCSDGGYWFSGGGGNYSIGGGAEGSGGGAGSWLSRKFPWLALGVIPVALLFALAKICSQKR